MVNPKEKTSPPPEPTGVEAMMAKAVNALEERLAGKIDELAAGIYEKVAADIKEAAGGQGKFQAALEVLPDLIQKQVETQLKANFTSIMEGINKNFEEKFKAMGSGNSGSGAPGSGLTLDNLLGHSEQIIGVINAFRSPTTEQAMMGQMAFVMKWHGLLSKLEKGGGSGDEVTKAIADTFTEQKQE